MKIILAIAIIAIAIINPIKAMKDELQWNNLRDKLIYTPKKIAFGKAALSSILTMPFWVVSLSIFRAESIIIPTMFITSALWIKFWNNKEDKSALIKFIRNWDDNKKDTPEECHEQFEILKDLLKNDSLKFEQQYKEEFELLRREILRHVKSSGALINLI